MIHLSFIHSGQSPSATQSPLLRMFVKLTHSEIEDVLMFIQPTAVVTVSWSYSGVEAHAGRSIIYNYIL